MDEEIKKKVQQSGNIEEMLRHLIEYYELDTCRPGVAVKSFVIAGLNSAIKMLKPLKR